MNIGLSAAALAAMGYFVYSSTSNSSVVLKGKTVLITGAGVRFHSTIIRRRNFYVKTTLVLLFLVLRARLLGDL